MTRLNNFELAELERRLARHEATQYPHEEHTAAALEYHDALFEHGANLIRELRALRAVREAAEAYRLVVARFNTTYREDGQSSIDLDQAEANLFNALDKAQ